MTTERPTSIEALATLVPSRPRWHVRAGGTKPALSSPPPDAAVLDLSGLSAILEYTPEECTFTALAGTRVVDIERVLAPHRQYLPFDPPFASAGATLGGTVAAGVNGSCRYRYGGIRDFLIGARIVDGQGRVVQSGGKVVKNAAGFLLHQAMVGSTGSLGVLAELTFKVFPVAEARATLRVESADLASAVAVVSAVQRERFELEAVDITRPGTVWLRLGGFGEALPTRVERLRQAVGSAGATLVDDQDVKTWSEARELAWVRAGSTLVRVPLTLPRVAAFDDTLAAHDANVRYTVAGNLAWIDWRGPLSTLGALLCDQQLVGQVLIGGEGPTLIGAVIDNPFEQRLRGVMDPRGRFRATSHSA